MGKLNKSNLAAVMALLVAFSVPRAVAVAPPQDWDLEGTFYSPGDCSGTGFDSCTSPTYSLTAEQLGRRPNILVIVADDQAYCQYGFMAGYCDSNPHLSCQYDRDCPLVGEDFDMCKRDAAGTTHDPGAGGATLRLNDPACRYRQRPAAKRTTTCKKNDDRDPKGAKGGDRVAYPFGRSEFPCEATQFDTNSPVYSTPHLDRLVQEGGVLFTRAYVSGNQCKTSRSSMMFGRHHRHNKWFSDDLDDEPDYPIADALERFDAEPGDDPPYVRVLLGKLEAMNDGVEDAHFQRSDDGAAPKVGRFKCSGGEATCKQAACAIDASGTRCADGESGQVAASKFPQTPSFAHDEDVRGSVAQLFDVLFREGRYADQGGPESEVIVTANGQYGIRRPFFLWFAPKAPHKGNYAGALRGLFTGHGLDQEKHMARVAQMDLTVGAVINELKASCVCVDDAWTSLWDHTVVLYLADHGFQMYEAKRTANDTNNRTPLIVSHPDNRNVQSPTPRVIDDEFVSTLDVYQTILGLAGATLPPDTPEFRYGRNLTARIEGTSSARIRKAVYAEWAKPKKTKFGIAAADTRIFYTIPAPGEVGVCASDDDSIVVRKPCDEDDDCGNSDCEKKNRVCKTKACSDDIECPSSTCDESGVCASGIVRHVRPCLDDAECPVSDDCDLTGGRCTHNPTLRCDLNAEDLNADCLPAGSLCVSGKCEYSRAAGSFGELAVSTDGVTPPNCGTESACVPADAVLCQPLMLKIQAEGAASVANVYIKKAWDLRWDPDQRQDLISMTVGSDEYLGDLVTRATGSLAEQATECLRDFWYLELDGGDLRWDQRSGSDCDTWAEPATTTTSSSTSTSSSSTSSTSTSSTTL